MDRHVILIGCSSADILLKSAFTCRMRVAPSFHQRQCPLDVALVIVDMEGKAEDAPPDRQLHSMSRQKRVEILQAGVRSRIMLLAQDVPDADDMREVWTGFAAIDRQIQSEQPMREPAGQSEHMAFNRRRSDLQKLCNRRGRGDATNIVVVANIESMRAGIEPVGAIAPCRL